MRVLRSLSLLVVGVTAVGGLFFVLTKAREDSLPKIAPPSETARLGCDEALDVGRRMVSQSKIDRARTVYLSLLSECGDSPWLPDAMIEAGSLLGHLQGAAGEARLVFEEFLRRFAGDRRSDDALFHLALAELDDGDYENAATHLEMLAQRFPDSAHRRSANVLAARALGMLEASRRWQGALLRQVARPGPNNEISLFALLAGVGFIGAALVQAIWSSGGSSRPRSRAKRLVYVSASLSLAALYFAMNLLESGRRSEVLEARLTQLATRR